MTSITSYLDSLCLRGILRCLSSRPIGPLSPNDIRLNNDDINALRFWWSLSETVGKLAERVRTRPREIAGVVGVEENVVIGEIPGALDACETARMQIRTGDPSIFVVAEPTPTWISGPNRLLAITLMEAERAISSVTIDSSRGLFSTAILERTKAIEDALRVSALREILMSPSGRARITSHERRQARKARTPLYRLARDSDEALQAVDALDANALTAMFAEGMLPALEIWKRFELACILECVASLSRVTGQAVILNTTFSAARPIATVGDISIWWQRAIRSRPDGELDEGEAIARNLSQSLGASSGTGRADVTIEQGDRILALIECKWFENSSSASSAIVDACEQLTRYSRDHTYFYGGDPMALLSKSIVALADRDGAPLVVEHGAIGCIGLSDIADSVLDRWATYVIAH